MFPIKGSVYVFTKHIKKPYLIFAVIPSMGTYENIRASITLSYTE